MDTQKTNKSRIIAAIMVATILLATTALTMTSITQGAFAYDRNQATSSANACGNGQVPTNIGCQNTDSQIQGDENSIALTSQQTFPSVTREPPSPPSPPSPPETATLIVIKNVKCIEGEECPNLPSPSAFLMQFQLANNPDPFSAPGSSEGTPFTLEPGDYIVTEALPPDPPGIEDIPSIRSEDCSSNANGPIQAGEERTCTWTNVYRPVSPP